jgi:uncharacterized DUF497 family protein
VAPKPGFDWDRHNEAHVRRHDVEPAEAEEALLDPDRIGASAYSVRGERRWAHLGATVAGRVLLVVHTYRQGRIRVVTARGASDREKSRWRRGR